MFPLRVILFPFSVVFDLITRIRNRLYDLAIKPSTRFEVPVIGVGNLAAGGTGKTPMIEYLIRLLGSGRKIATLSRGYGRRTKGFRVASDTDNAETIGDEPYQLYGKFSDVMVVVGEDRVLAVSLLLDRRPDINLILADDAFQHRRLRPAFQILLTDYHRPFYTDFLLPAGWLREARTGASRADAVVVTKCPAELSPDEELTIQHAVAKYAGCPVFFAGIRYKAPLPFGDHNQTIGSRVLLVTGIANADPVRRHIEDNFEMTHHVAFRDHHRYSAQDLIRLKAMAQRDTSIVTTEKDMVKLAGLTWEDGTRELPFFYLPMEMYIKNGRDFEELIKAGIRK